MVFTELGGATLQALSGGFGLDDAGTSLLTGIGAMVGLVGIEGGVVGTTVICSSKSAARHPSCVPVRNREQDIAR
jgi:hypothetical protein